MKLRPKSVDGGMQAPELLVLVKKHGASTRIQNALEHAYRHGYLRTHTVKEYLSASPIGVPLEFLSLPGFGVRSARELDRLVRANPQTTLEHSVGERSPMSASPLPAAFRTAPFCGLNADASFPRLDDVLTPREREIVERRFGLGVARASTLEAIGFDHGCTRERIRQIESKAIKALHRTRTEQFLAFLVARAKTISEKFWGERFWLCPKDAQLRANELEAEVLLAMAIVYGSTTGWLNKTAVRESGGWLRHAVPKSELLEVRAKLERYRKVRALPIPLHEASEELHCEEKALGAAVDTSKTLRMYDGFICPAIVGARIRRTLTLVRLLLAHGRGVALSQRRLIEEVRGATEPLEPQWRDLQIVLAANKHLFVNLFEEGWATCAPKSIGANPLVSLPSVNAKSRADSEVDEDVTRFRVDLTLKEHLVAELKKKGPMQLNEIRDRFDEWRLTGYSKASIGPTLITYEEFMRLAPGIYVLRDDWMNGRISREQLDRLLLSEQQCTLYCQARWAGEPRNLYPAWTESAELSWARWAYRNSNTSLLESLLAVVDLSDWPISQVERRTWLGRVGRGAHYSLAEVLRVSLDETVPNFENVLAASLWARQAGHLSWMSANRVTGKRVNDRHAASVLALLVVFGIIQPAEHWQGQHTRSDDVEEQVESMLDHAFAGGAGWPQRLSSLAAAGARHWQGSGWLKDQEVESLLQRVSGTERGQARMADIASENGADIMVEMKERARRAKLAELVGR